MLGLVLTAGGARGAYQAGVLKRIGEIPRLKDGPSPFQIITGASAGAINGTLLACEFERFRLSTELLAELWGEVQVEQVFKTDAVSLGLRSAQWIQDLSLGGFLGGGGAQSLLDFSPLRVLLSKYLSFESLARAIESRHLYAVAISATSYFSGKSFTFVQGQSGHPLWDKSRRIAVPTQLDVDHVWASCAIPVVFQPVQVQTPLGDFYFGDGGLRLVNPLSPAIRLGATRVFAIGIRSQKAAESRVSVELKENGHSFELSGATENHQSSSKFKMVPPPLAQVFGVTLNSIFLDHLDTDLDHLNRMNQFLLSYQPHPEKAHEIQEPMRVVKPFAINPSVDLAAVAEKYDHKMPRVVRYLMEGLGSVKAQSADLMSYLLFDSSYTKALIDIGYDDAHQQIAEIEHFLFSESQI